MEARGRQSQQTRIEVDEGRRLGLAGGFEQRREHVGCLVAPHSLWLGSDMSRRLVRGHGVACTHREGRSSRCTQGPLFALSHRTRELPLGRHCP